MRGHGHRPRPVPAGGIHAVPDLTIHRAYNGYWYWGRATLEEIRRDMREITREIRDDWEVLGRERSAPVRVLELRWRAAQPGGRGPGRRLRVDARCLDGEPVRGAFAHVCALGDENAALRFDEPEVQQARRDALSWWIPLLGDDLVCLSTFALDASRCAGAVTVARDPIRFEQDPFARLFPGPR